jgi:hypothetical protein
VTNIQKELALADARIRELEDEVSQLLQKWTSPTELDNLKTWAWQQGHDAALRGEHENPYG